MFFQSRHSAAYLTRLIHLARPGSILATLVLLALTNSFSSTLPSARADSLLDKSNFFLPPVAADKARSGWSAVIVQLSGRSAPKQRRQIASLGGYVYRHLPLIRAVAVRIPKRNLARLAALPFVVRLSIDSSVQKNDEFTVSSSGADVAYDQYHLTGAGVTVAVIDSGIQDNKDFADRLNSKTSRLLASVDFVTGADPAAGDLCGHGTHAAAIIAGNGANSTGPNYYRTFYGIARRANLVNVRVLDAQGQGIVSNVVAAVQWVVNNKSTYNIRVINLSLGHEVGESYTTDPLCRAVEQAWKAGVVVVCAAGNSGRLQPVPNSLLPDNEGYSTAYGSILSPANSPYVITVGAMKAMGGGRLRDRIATYSSRGPSRLDFILKPDLVAPGNRVISANAAGSYLSGAYGATNLVPWQAYCYSQTPGDGSRYFSLSGTSMAAPVVSGAAALLLQADPGLSPDSVKARLMFSANKWAFPDGSMDPCTFGAGYLNIPAALNHTAVTTQYALSPSLSRGLLDGVFLTTDSSFSSDLGIWGTGVHDIHTMWGSSFDSDTRSMSSSGAVWSAPVWSDSAVFPVLNGGVDLSWIVVFGDERNDP